MGKKGKNGANKKLHNKLVKRKRPREQDSKEVRKKIMRDLNKKASDLKSNEINEED